MFQKIILRKNQHYFALNKYCKQMFEEKRLFEFILHNSVRKLVFVVFVFPASKPDSQPASQQGRNVIVQRIVIMFCIVVVSSGKTSQPASRVYINMLIFMIYIYFKAISLYLFRSAYPFTLTHMRYPVQRGHMICNNVSHNTQQHHHFLPRP